MNVDAGTKKTRHKNTKEKKNCVFGSPKKSLNYYLFLTYMSTPIFDPDIPANPIPQTKYFSLSLSHGHLFVIFLIFSIFFFIFFFFISNIRNSIGGI